MDGLETRLKIERSWEIHSVSQIVHLQIVIFALTLFKANVEDSTLRDECRQLSQQSKVPYEQLINAAEVAKHRYDYYSSSKDALAGISSPDGPPLALKVTLSLEDKKALVAERERLFSGRGMLIIIWTVSLAAFLQGHVQSSINAGSLFAETVGITEPRVIDLTASGSNYTFDFVRDAINGINKGIYNDTYLDVYIPENGTYYRADRTEKIPQGLNMTGVGVTSIAKWQLGGMNAIPFLTAAFPGAPLSLPVNYCFGRRGALGISALLIIASSLGSAFASTWQQVLGARIVGGIGESSPGSESNNAPLEARLTHPLQPWESRPSVPPSSPPRQPWATGEALPSWHGSYGKTRHPVLYLNH